MHYFLLRGMWPSFSEQKKHALEKGREKQLSNSVINTKMTSRESRDNESTYFTGR